MRTLLFILAMGIAQIQAHAACTYDPVGIGLCYPNFGDRGDVWAADIRRNFVILNSSWTIAQSSPTYNAMRINNWLNVGSSITAASLYASSATFTGTITASTASATYLIGDNLFVGPRSAGWFFLPPPVEISVPNKTLGQPASVFIRTTDAPGQEVGGAIDFGGRYYTGSANAVPLAGIAGRKENSTDNNYAGYLQLVTRPNGGTMTEHARITSAGRMGLGTVSPAYKLDVTGDGHFTSSVTVDGGLYGTLNGNATTATTATNLAGGAAGQLPIQSAAGATTFTTPASANTASALVLRDASGNFSAGTITASLAGNATTATTATNVASGGTIAAATAVLTGSLTASSATVTGTGIALNGGTITGEPAGFDMRITNAAGARLGDSNNYVQAANNVVNIYSGGGQLLTASGATGVVTFPHPAGVSVTGSAFSVGVTTLNVSAGNVTIGTATAGYPLKVYKAGAHTPILSLEGEGTGEITAGFDSGHNIKISAPASRIWGFYGDSTNLLQIYTQGELYTYGGGTAALPALARLSDTDTGIFFPAGGQTGITTDGTERMRVTSSGIGIGTGTPVGNLDIYRSDAQQTKLVLRNAGNIGNSIDFGVGGPTELASRILGYYDAATGGTLSFWTGWNVPTEKMRITSAGNVGVGISNPTTKFQLSSGTARIDGQGAGILLTPGTSHATDATVSVVSSYPDGYTAQLELSNIHTGGRNYRIKSTNCSDGNFGCGMLIVNDATAGANTARLAINAAGKVGISTIAPTHQFSVAGGIVATSSITAQAGMFSNALALSGTGAGVLYSNGRATFGAGETLYGQITGKGPLGDVSIFSGCGPDQGCVATPGHPNYSAVIEAASGYTGGLNFNQLGANPIRFWTNDTERGGFYAGGGFNVVSSATVGGELYYGANSVSPAAGWDNGASGGYYVTNMTTSTLSSGTVVHANISVPSTFGTIRVSTADANSIDPLGTIFDSIAPGASGKICTRGLCPLRLDSNSACAASGEMGAFTGSQIGRGQCSSAPSSTLHFQELGNPVIFSAVNGDVIWIDAHRN